jgi:hypothetical protein
VAGFFGDEVVLAGTTWTTVLPSPGAAEQREVVRLFVWNRDTVSHVVKARKVTGAGNLEIYSPLTLAAGQRGHIDVAGSVIDETDESIQVQSDATATTTEPLVDIGAFDTP